MYSSTDRRDAINLKRALFFFFVSIIKTVNCDLKARANPVDLDLMFCRFSDFTFKINKTLLVHEKSNWYIHNCNSSPHFDIYIPNTQCTSSTIKDKKAKSSYLKLL